jgi:hypothetical protein
VGEKVVKGLSILYSWMILSISFGFDISDSTGSG